jgi:hypothetical protein
VSHSYQTLVLDFTGIGVFACGLHDHVITRLVSFDDEDQPNSKRNHANDPLEVPITRVRAKKLKEALNECFFRTYGARWT